MHHVLSLSRLVWITLITFPLSYCKLHFTTLSKEVQSCFFSCGVVLVVRTGAKVHHPAPWRHTVLWGALTVVLWHNSVEKPLA